MPTIKHIKAAFFLEMEHANNKKHNWPRLIIESVLWFYSMIIAIFVWYCDHYHKTYWIAAKSKTSFNFCCHLLFRSHLHLSLHLLLKSHLIVIRNASLAHKANINLTFICTRCYHHYVLLWIVWINGPYLPVIKINSVKLYLVNILIIVGHILISSSAGQQRCNQLLNYIIILFIYFYCFRLKIFTWSKSNI